MPVSITRRAALASSALAVPLLASARGRAAQAADPAAQLADLETRSGGRLGVAVLDVATGRRISHRADERFALCSTFKVLAAAFILARVDRGEERLDRRVTFTERDLVAPFKATKPHVGAEGMTMAQLCEAAITVSDSTAANLLLASFGGPAGLTAYLRSLGDPVTRLDRMELDLNVVPPGDVRDTTSPAAMTETMRRLVLGDALTQASRTRLAGWMFAATDAAKHRLRVGFPRGWRVGNKPGTWVPGATNDVAVAWPPDRGPIVVSAYLAGASTPVPEQAAVLAEVGRIVAAWL